jgi:hypothetical protein
MKRKELINKTFGLVVVKSGAVAPLSFRCLQYSSALYGYIYIYVYFYVHFYIANAIPSIAQPTASSPLRNERS